MHGDEAPRRGWGKPISTRHRTALVAALACVSLLAVGIADQAAARHRAKSSSAATVKSDKLATSGEKASSEKASGGKKTAKGKSKDDKSPPPNRQGCRRSRSPPGPEPEVSAADVALVKRSPHALRKRRRRRGNRRGRQHLGPGARKLVEWSILRDGAQWCRILALPRLHRRQSDLAERSACSVAAPRRCCGSRTRAPRKYAELLQRRAAPLRQGPPGTGACLARGG